jgi:lysophospholipase L1-like esterase
VCHRHARAYPNQLRSALDIHPSDYIFVACSGAVTENIGLVDNSRAQYAGLSPVNVAGGKTQIDTVVPGFTAQGEPDFVLIGVGGNDAGFADMIKECLRDCLNDYEFVSGTLANINNYVFRQVRQTLRGLRERFPAATVVAFGYPDVIGDPDQPCASTGLGPWKLNHDELVWLRDHVLPALNSAIADAAAEAGVVYADIMDSTEGHELCSASDDRWINGVRGGDDEGVFGKESFHPNQRGHDAIADYFLAHYTDGNGRLLVSNPDPSGPTRSPNDSRVYLGSIDATGVTTCGSDCLQPSSCVQGCRLHVDGRGFAPGSTLRVTLHSDPVELGSLVADETGRVAGEFNLPGDVEPGEHALTLRGTTGGGQQQFGTTFITVLERPQTPPPEADDPPDQPENASGLLTGNPVAPILPVAPGDPPAASRVRSVVSARWRVRNRRTRVASMVVRAVPEGSTVAVACSRRRSGRSAARGCGLQPRRYAVTQARARLPLTRLFRRPLTPGTVINVTITRPGWIGRRYSYRVRATRRPAASVLCLPAGSTVARKRC